MTSLDIYPPTSSNVALWSVVTGDCIKVMRCLAAGSARLIFADPPYNLGVDYGDGTQADLLPRGEYLARSRRWIEEASRLLTSDGSLWVLIEPRWAGRIQCILEDVGLHYRETIAWVETFGTYCKTRFGMDHRTLFRFTKYAKRQVFHPDRVPSDRQVKYNDKRANPRGRIPGNVWTISRVCGTFRERLADFPTQLPLELLNRVVACSSDPGDLVLDPFSGSATTGVAAISSGRRYIGIEISAAFAELSRSRLAEVVAIPGHCSSEAAS